MTASWEGGGACSRGSACQIDPPQPDRFPLLRRRPDRAGAGLRHPHRREWRGQDQCAGGGLAALARARPAGREPRRNGAARRRRAASRWRRGSARSRSAPAPIADAPERRQVRINGAPASANSLSEWLSVLWLTPAMDRLFADAAAGRRRFLDRLVLALEPRPRHPRRPLRSGDAGAQQVARPRTGRGTRPGWPRSRRGWPSMAPRIAEARAATVGRAGGAAGRRARRPVRPRRAWRSKAARRRDLAARAARRDAAAGRTLAGPHRADLAVTHLGKDQPAALSLDRRAEGAADRPRPRPCRSRRRARRPPPDPAARRDRRPSRPPPPRRLVRAARAAPAARSG